MQTLQQIRHWSFVWTLIIAAAIAHMLPMITLAFMACAHAEQKWKALAVFSAAHALSWVAVWYCHYLNRK